MNPFTSIPKSNAIITAIFSSAVGLGLAIFDSPSTILNILLGAGLIMVIVTISWDNDGEPTTGAFMALAGEVALLSPVLVQVRRLDPEAMMISAALLALVILICVVIAAVLARRNGNNSPFMVLLLEAIPVAGLIASFGRYCYEKARADNEAD